MLRYLQLHEIWIYAIIGIACIGVFSESSDSFDKLHELYTRILQMSKAWKITWITAIVALLFAAEWEAIKYHRVVLRVIPEMLLCAVVIYAPQLFIKRADSEAQETLHESECLSSQEATVPAKNPITGSDNES